MQELPQSRRDRKQKLDRSFQSSALQVHHAQTLIIYIKEVFLAKGLLGEGVEPPWTLDGPASPNITFNKWTIFQQHFMEGWQDFVTTYGDGDSFWTDNQPAFHAYDDGANIEIEAGEQLDSLSKETRLGSMKVQTLNPGQSLIGMRMKKR